MLRHSRKNWQGSHPILFPFFNWNPWVSTFKLNLYHNLVWQQLDLKTGSHWVKLFSDRTGPPRWLVTSADSGSHKESTCCGFKSRGVTTWTQTGNQWSPLVSRLLLQLRCPVPTQVSVPNSYTLFIIYCWLIIHSHSPDMIQRYHSYSLTPQPLLLSPNFPRSITTGLRKDHRHQDRVLWHYWKCEGKGPGQGMVSQCIISVD